MESLLSMSIFLSLILSGVNHPLSLGLVLLFQALLVCFFVGGYSFSYWFSYILFLIFLGGMLILFLYVASLAMDESFGLLNKNYLKGVSFLFVFILSCIFILYLVSFYFMGVGDSLSNLNFYNNEIGYIIYKFYSLMLGFLSVSLIFYLFFVLVVVVFTSVVKCGPIRLSVS
uniref:NADH-ubiquinone oxidoreductase chain 6 n=1 Tax=Hutchinsoniella macracantha TaxID=84335 RepID=Q6SKZ5_9CRUS|nr:NADH dehydrogenase subunit 6 [Hutchinsoniella macracantha]